MSLKSLENDELIKLVEVKRTGQREWVAAIDLIKWNENEEGETVKDWPERCATRNDAIQVPSMSINWDLA